MRGTDSYACTQKVFRAIQNMTNGRQPTAVAIKPQQNTSHEGNNSWWGGIVPRLAARYNFEGMMHAIELMQQHSLARNSTYHAAIRWRADAGSAHINWRRHGLLDDSGWASVHRRAMAVAQGHMFHATTLHSCHTLAPAGVKWADNCLWSAPPTGLTDTLARVLSGFNAYLPMEAAGEPRAHMELLCAPNTVLAAEAIIGCAMRDLGLVGCPVACKGCGDAAPKHVTAQMWSSSCPKGFYSHPYCTPGGPCPAECCACCAHDGPGPRVQRSPLGVKVVWK